MFLHTNMSPKWNLAIPADFEYYSRRWQVMSSALILPADLLFFDPLLPILCSHPYNATEHTDTALSPPPDCTTLLQSELYAFLYHSLNGNSVMSP